MRLSWVELRDFRNHRETRLEVPPGVSAVVGDNGQGKTNLLEGVYYLFSLESPRASADLPLIRAGASSAFVRGEVETGTGRVLVEVEVRPSGANRVQVNRSPVRRKRDVRQKVRAVFFMPDDIAVVQGEPDERRRLMDAVVVSLWPARDAGRRAYDKALRQRNRLLKDWEGGGTPAGMAAWDAELVEAGAALTRDRARAVERIREAASDAFAELSGGDRLDVAYRPSVEPSADPEDLDALAARFRERLAARREDELVRRTTLVGPHRDELDLAVRTLAARSFASHGEALVGALCLRLAQARAVRDEVGEPPVLFLDDPFSGLDPVRRRRLAGTVSGLGQVLLSVPDAGQVPAGARTFRVEEGRVAAA